MVRRFLWEAASVVRLCWCKARLDGGDAFGYGYAGGWGEGEVGVFGWDVFLHGGEGEVGDGTVDLFQAHLLDQAG